jgi:hypothetical protein
LAFLASKRQDPTFSSSARLAANAAIQSSLPASMASTKMNKNKKLRTEDKEVKDSPGKAAEAPEAAAAPLAGGDQEGAALPPFRLNAKKLFLTYPKLELSPEKVLTELMDKDLSIVDFVIGREAHQDGTPHIHAYLALAKKVNITNARRLDIKGFHGRYEGVRNPNKAIEYAAKGRQFVTNLNIEGGRLVTLKERLHLLAQKGETAKALEVLRKAPNALVLDKYSVWKRNIEQLSADSKSMAAGPRYPVTDYEFPEGIKD